MKTLILYFSGTGNTLNVAKGYEHVLKEKGHEVECYSIEDINSLPEHELLIIGGPIYAGNVPDELIQWVRKSIQKTEVNRNAIVFTTSAGLLNANGTKSIAKKLIKKGYTIIDMPTFEMPRNFYIDKYDPTPLVVQEKQVRDTTERLFKSVNKIQMNNQLNVSDSVLGIDFLADIFRIMAKSMGHNFKIDDTCIQCGKCERDCPKTNIDYKNKTYHNNCMLCTRCIHNCPVNAISYKDKKIEQYIAPVLSI